MPGSDQVAATAIRAERRVLAALILFAGVACVLLIALRSWLPLSGAFLMDVGLFEKGSTRLVPISLAAATAAFHVGLMLIPVVSWVATRLGYRAYTMFALATSGILLLIESLCIGGDHAKSRTVHWLVLCVTRALMGVSQASFLLSSLDMISSHCFFAGVSSETVTFGLRFVILFALGPGTLILAAWDPLAHSLHNAYSARGTAIILALVCVSVGVLGFWLSNEYSLLSRDELSEVEYHREELETKVWSRESELSAVQSRFGPNSAIKLVLVFRMMCGCALCFVYGCLLYSILTWFPLIVWRMLVFSLDSVFWIRIWLVSLAALALLMSLLCSLLSNLKVNIVVPLGLLAVFICARILGIFDVPRHLWTLCLWVFMMSCCLGMYEPTISTAFDVTADMPIIIPSTRGTILQTSLQIGAALGILLPAFMPRLNALEIVYSFLAICALILFSGACLVLYLEGKHSTQSESKGLLR